MTFSSVQDIIDTIEEVEGFLQTYTDEVDIKETERELKELREALSEVEGCEDLIAGEDFDEYCVDIVTNQFNNIPEHLLNISACVNEVENAYGYIEVEILGYTYFARF